MKEPESIDECVYFTNRSDGKGYIKAWVLRGVCLKCGKGLMSKPKNPKTGKYKIRSIEYVCYNCGFSINKEEYEDTLNINIKYKCPDCENEGELELPFRRARIQVKNEETGKKKSVEGIRFQCSKCKKNIDIIKKMKT